MFYFSKTILCLFSFFYIVSMVKLFFINPKACLINRVLQFYLYQILFSIIFWIPFEKNILFFSKILCIYIFLLNKFW